MLRLLLTLSALVLMLLPQQNVGAKTIFVAPEGNDANTGTAEAPLATPQGARDAVRRWLATGATENLRIEFRTGTYFLHAPIELSPEDTPPEGKSITYIAAPQAEVVFTGGLPITGWEKVENNVWRANVNGLQPFRDLYRDGERLMRARHPNAPELLRVTEVSPDYRAVTLRSETPSGAASLETLLGRNPAGAELVMYQNWSITRVAVESVEGEQVTAAVPIGWIGHGDATTASVGKPAYLEHCRAALDMPREWYLDAQAQCVLYRAAEGEDPNNSQFIAPQTGQWLRLHGTPEKPVRGIHFEGITFAHSAWTLPTFGYIGIQAGHHGTTLKEKTYVLPNAIELIHAHECRFDRCTIAHTGASGIGFGRGCRRNRVTRCTIEDIGGNGVVIGWRGTGEMETNSGDGALAADWPEVTLAPLSNEVSGCVVTRCGAVNHGCVGIFAAFSALSKIRHNLVYDMPYTGISVGFYWGTKPTSQQEAWVDNNHIHDVMKMLADGGGIYTLGYQKETFLSGNLIHDVHRSAFAHGGAPNNGIFFDEGSSGFHVSQNAIYNTAGEPIRFNQTSEDKFYWNNNSFGVKPDAPEFPKAVAVLAGPRPGANKPKYGVIINEDNSHFFGSRTAEEMSLEGLQAFVDQYANTQVTHLFLNPNAMRASYDSAVRDVIWEVGNQVVPDLEVARKWVENARLLHERGLDPYAVWIARCREQGISPWLTMRMNDVHDVNDTTNYMHSTFWVQHPEYWRVPGSQGAWQDRALDYGIPEVREHNLALVRELLERYDPDGLELDWMRFGWHFAPGKEAEGADILTDFMRTVRGLGSEASKKRGHPILLGARVPTHPDAARGLGMDGVRWAKEGLIDWLVPSPFWATADFDIPIELWREQLGDASKNIVLAAGQEILLQAYPGAPQIENDLASLRGFASAALHRRANAIYLFNYMDPGPMPGGAGSYQNLL
ncbi:MAG: right-handed parallel beta-helix repeat-containing protein, partial [Candidatus Hydrogenedentes bacterium]|nr:right-handed parallel beta-helix repeat-containing protein [Candidatus Hydrogenedentota bacterium]